MSCCTGSNRGQVAKGETFLSVLQFYPVSIIPSLLHIYLCITYPTQT
jgi:hypothetical protein